MMMQIWRHRPSGEHYAVYLDGAEVIMAKGPITAKQAADLTALGFDESENNQAAVSVLNAAPWEFDPVWQDARGDFEDAEWLKAVMEPADDGTLG